MNTVSSDRGSSPLAQKYALILAAVWTLLIVCMAVREAFHEMENARELVRNEAGAHFRKDQAFRLWVAGHGGVYVPPTGHTPPNPALSHIPDRDIETTAGKKLTLMNPAYVVRELMEDYEKLYGVKGHITSLKPLRPENAPDAWERKSLESFERGVTEAEEFTEIDGKPYLRLMHPMVVKQSCLKCHAQQGYKEGEIRGGFGVSVSAAPFFAAARAKIVSHSVDFGLVWLLGLVLIAFAGRNIRAKDIARKRAEAERERLFKVLGFKNKELQDIVYTASHDLRTPLVSIQGFSGELARDCDHLLELLGEMTIDQKQRERIEELARDSIPESLKFITGGTSKMSSLLDGLLQVSRIGSVEIRSRTLDMDNTVRGILDSMEYQIQESDIAVTVDSLPDCTGDKNMLDRVFTNLIGNAIKYSDPAKDSEIRISGRVEGSMSVYCIEDNGIGIATGHQKKVFEIFHRLNPSGSIDGEGLGLTIVTRIIDRLGGRVWVESEADEGCKFFFTLPKA